MNRTPPAQISPAQIPLAQPPLAQPFLARSPRAPRFIAIASGKGGVGKTWFAVTLAHALAQRRRRVLLVDADFGLANVDIQLGLMPQHDLGDVLAARTPLDRAILPVPDAGFHVLPGRSGSGALANLPQAALDQVQALLRNHAPAYDHVLLDLGAGVEPGVRKLAAWAQLLIVLATEDPSSVTDAYATIKLHHADAPAGDARLVLNQVASPAAAARTANLIRRACTTFLGLEIPLLGHIRRDPKVPDAIRRQTLLLRRHPTSNAAIDITRIADAL